jgi:hypothetical protein
MGRDEKVWTLNLQLSESLQRYSCSCSDTQLLLPSLG